MRDFFGNYRDPMWDKMDQIKADMEVMREALPDMEKKIADLEAELASEKRRTQAYVLYKAADHDQTVSALIAVSESFTRSFAVACLKNETYLLNFSGPTWLQVLGIEAEWLCQVRSGHQNHEATILPFDRGIESRRGGCRRRRRRFREGIGNLQRDAHGQLALRTRA